MAFWF